MVKYIVTYHTVENSNESEHTSAPFKNMQESHKNNIEQRQLVTSAHSRVHLYKVQKQTKLLWVLEIRTVAQPWLGEK